MSNFIKFNKMFFAKTKWRPKIPKHQIIFDKSTYRSPHPIWDLDDAERVEVTHVRPKTIRDHIAFGLMRILRVGFDYFSGYSPGNMTEKLYLRRVIFLETIAGCPGMIGGMLRHLKALRSLKEDGGWIHHLLEEAENERMHLLTFLEIRQPGILMRTNIMIAQLIFFSSYTLMYIISSKLSHKFVGYLEEEAVKTYSNLLKELDEGKLPGWEKMEASKISKRYWGLQRDAKMRDIILSVRADEVFHREFNHHFAEVPSDHKIEGHQFVIAEGTKIWEDTESEEEIERITREEDIKSK